MSKRELTERYEILSVTETKERYQGTVGVLHEVMSVKEDKTQVQAVLQKVVSEEDKT